MNKNSILGFSKTLMLPYRVSVRIIFTSLFVVSAISILFWCPYITSNQKKEIAEYNSFAEKQVEIIEKALHFGMLNNQRDTIQSNIDSLSTLKDVSIIRIINNDGIVKFSSNKDEINNKCLNNCVELKKHKPDEINIRDVIGNNLMISKGILNSPSCYTASCHFHKPEERIVGRIEYGISYEAFRKNIRKQGMMIASFGIVFISSLSLLLYATLNKIILKRLYVLQDAANKTASGDLTHSIPVDNLRDEITELSGAFNYMIGELRKKKEDIEKELNTYKQSLLQSQKMEAIGLLSAGIAHDFKNLITGIMGFSEIARMNTKDPTVIKNLDKVIDTAKKAAELTQQILLIGRKVPPDKKSTDINAFIMESLNVLRRMVEENIQIKNSFKDSLPIVKVDQNQLMQVLMNLVINARDAMPNGGTITIKTDEVSIDEDYCKNHPEALEGRYIMISVSDTGHGISKEIQDKIFEPFFTTKERGKGTGLGLSITYSIIKSHQGFMNLYTEEGKGTTFNVYLPITEEPVVFKKENNKTIKGAKGSETILIVDDEEIIREVGKTMLEGLGYMVLTAANGKEAVDIYRERGKEIDLIIMDLIMPVMDGPTASKEILTIDKNARIIISSGYSQDRIEELEGYGIKGFINKPFSIAELAEKIRGVLDEIRDLQGSN